jgi:hypothetical protein
VHPYSTNSEERTVTPFFLAAVAMLVAWTVAEISGELHVPFWLEIPGVFTTYGLLFLVFRKYLWKIGFFRFICRVKVPNLEGQWEGYGTTSFDGESRQHITLKISQDWTHILVKLVAPTSTSRSITASIFITDAESVLHYQYTNDPNVRATKTMHSHAGSASLEVSHEASQLSGDYFSGRDRATHGEIVLHRKITP